MSDSGSISRRDWERIKRLRLMDDDFFRVCFQDDKKGVEFILRIIMDKPDLDVTHFHTQHALKNLKGHSVIFDVFATDSDGRLYDIEVQRADSGATPKRARYNSSVIDVNMLHSSEDYDLLPHSYVIFITENDVLGEGRLIYHIERIITESGGYFNDFSHIVYVNASSKDDSALGKLMHDFNCVDPAEMHYDELREKTVYFKDEEKGAKKMCQIWEEVRQEGIDIGMERSAKAIAEAETKAAEAETKAAEAETKAAEAEAAKMIAETKERATKNALRMIKRGNLSIEEIVEYTGLTEAEVREYAELIAG